MTERARIGFRGSGRMLAGARTIVRSEDGEMMAAPRDASFYASPSTGPRHDATWRVHSGHYGGTDDGAACGRSPILIDDMAEPISRVEDWQRCGRPGCREHWPKKPQSSE